MKVLYTTVSSLQRSITLNYDGGISQRYALYRFNSGDVYWRVDDFRDPADPSEPPRWVASHGRATLAEVVERVPDHAGAVLDWTRQEIGLGNVVADDMFAAMQRQEALERLKEELSVASRLMARSA